MNRSDDAVTFTWKTDGCLVWLVVRKANAREAEETQSLGLQSRLPGYEAQLFSSMTLLSAFRPTSQLQER